MELKNRLSGSSSPYLRQHAQNPVAWFPWGPAAFDQARKEKKPLLLSIGYSACHWCHVMAHESFEHEETAKLMNQYFINIKVDREQRPDIDKIYQTSHALLTNRAGGWPLTVFLDYESHAPFFSGTYFPKESRHGLPSFREVLASIANYFPTHTAEVAQQGKQIKNALQAIYAPRTSRQSISPELSNQAYQQLLSQFDRRYGGFGDAPKFPQPSNLDFLIHHAQECPEKHGEQALTMALHTLQSMALAGVYDQIGGGFYRYAVDRAWMIPHFEKMLYDNGLLMSLLADANTLSDNTLFSVVLAETAQWVMREMQSPKGGFYASLDADSEGHEGKYYLWDKKEMEPLLDSATLACLQNYLNLNQPANFENRWHLHVVDDTQRCNDHKGLIAAAKNTLLKVRQQRVAPGLDDKVLTAWNALMIQGMAKAALSLNHPACADSAQQAFNFVHRHLWDGQQLFSCWSEHGVEKISYLDDYALLLEAVLWLLQLQWCDEKFEFANALATALIDQFEDTEHGGYLFTPHQHEKLLGRLRIFHDEALPCGYSIATCALIQLGSLCGNEKYLDSARRALHQAGEVLEREPAHCTTLLRAANLYHQLPEIVILRGRQENMQAWKILAHQHFSSTRLCFAIPSDANPAAAAIADKKPPADPQAVIAYICRGTRCLEPIDTLEAFKQYLDKHCLKTRSLPA